MDTKEKPLVISLIANNNVANHIVQVYGQALKNLCYQTDIRLQSKMFSKHICYATPFKLFATFLHILATL